MSVSNFQDVVVLNGSTITAGIEALIVGTDNASTKSVIFAQDPAQQSALFLVASNPSGVQTLVIPAANGTVGLITQLSFPGTVISNGTLSVANASGIVWGVNGNTVTAALSRISGMTINDFAGTFPLSSSFSTTFNGAIAGQTTSFSTSGNSAIRVGVIAPLNISYMDPGGQQQLKLTGSINTNTTVTGSLFASLSWWAGIFTISGSTASVVSSTSNSTLVSGTIAVSNNGVGTLSSSVNVDGRFTNLTWDFTLGDYLFLQGSTLSVSMSVNGVAGTNEIGVTLGNTAFGASRAQVSYSVPYFADGTVSVSTASYNLTNIVQSGGTGFTSLAPRIEFIGS